MDNGELYKRFRAELEWYESIEQQTDMPRVCTLHIINANTPAYEFWAGVFKLQLMQRNDVDSFYWIVGTK